MVVFCLVKKDFCPRFLWGFLWVFWGVFAPDFWHRFLPATAK